MLKYMLDTDIAIYIGFPIALVLAWIFDVTPQGVVRTDAGTTTGLSRGRKLDAVIIVVPSTTSTAEHPRACRLGAPSHTRPHPICSPNAEKHPATGPPARPNPRLPETPCHASGNGLIEREQFARFFRARQ